jgi:FtsP/CotA-like multicopper oxidase with cupredoxin domain
LCQRRPSALQIEECTIVGMVDRVRLRRWAGIAFALAFVGTPAWWWYDSLLPSAYSVTDMGGMDLGGGGGDPHADHRAGISVADLTGDTAGTPTVAVTMIARKERFTLLTGEQVDGYTINHTSPGPVLRACEGDLVAVTLANESVPDGVTLHWHGVDVPNAADGVAGVTQDEVPVGGSHVYRFRADDPGTYWYHSHQVGHLQVLRGLFGALVVSPKGACDSQDVVAVVHTYDGVGTISGRTGTQHVSAVPGAAVRVRVVNTENGTITLAVYHASFRVLAVDGRDVHDPPEVRARTVSLAAGGRVDLLVTVPIDGYAARLDLGAGAGNILALGPAESSVAPLQAVTGGVDFLTYGSPAPIGFDPDRADRRFEYRIGRRYGFFNGRLGNWWTVNGALWPDVPMFMVNEGDIVVMTIRNDSGSAHPMHLHGHHAVVIARNGIKATGSPWWTDSLDVEREATYVIAFRANNPGIWMDHCHNLTHAAAGLTAHLGYFGVTEPFRIGPGSGPDGGSVNVPD